jgi:hypothetical protein
MAFSPHVYRWELGGLGDVPLETLGWMQCLANRLLGGSMIAGDWVYLVAWFTGAFWFGLFVMIPFVCSFLACQVKQVDVS